MCAADERAPRPATGRWFGTGVAVAFSDGRISLLVPEDEEDLAKRSWADEVRTFKPGSLNELITTAEAIRNPLREVAQSFSAELARAGFEAQETSEPCFLCGHPRSRAKRIEPRDLVLVHCNSYADGYWTDITRTYCMGKLEGRPKQMYEAVFAAREVALAAVRPGARAAHVDKPARDALEARGYPPLRHGDDH